MASSSVGDRQLQRIIKDLHDAVTELCKEHRDCGEPITDDCANLHKFFYKLEYLLQFDQKEKATFLGQRKDYWDYFCECLVKIKGHNDGIRFVKSIPELKTSLGKGRAFIRYSLVHQRLADTLQQCLINQKVTSDWYYARSPFLKPHLTADIINHLYELNQVQFDVAARGYDLDADWPIFARRTLGSCSPAYLWKPPSRCSSINSLSSSFSHTQAQEIQVPDLNPGLLGELAEPAPSSTEENLRLALDQSELRQQELLVQVEGLGREAAELKGVIKDLQEQLSAGRMQETCHQDRGIQHQSRWDSTVMDLRDRLAAAEDKNMELLLKLDEKEQQTSWKVQTSEDDRLSQQLKVKEDELRKSREELADVRARGQIEREEALVRLEELQSAVGRIQGALTVKEKETGNLRAQLQDLQASLERRERQAEDLKKRLQEERQEEEQRCFLSQSEEVLDLRKALRSREKEVASSSERIKHLEEQLEKLNVVKEESSDYGKLREDKQQLLQEVRRSERSVTELTEARAALLDQLAVLKASQNHLQGRVEAAKMSVEDREKNLLEENLHLEEALQKLLLQKEESERRVKRLDQENQELLRSQSSLKQEVDLLHTKAEQLEKEFTRAQGRQEELQEELQETEVKLEQQTVRCGLLQAQELERRNGEKGAAETNEELDLQTSSQEAPMKLVLAEAQLELHQKEVLRLQEEVVELRAQLLVGNEERLKMQALQEVTETSREDLRVLADQLKAQVEELNRRHVDDMLRSREREEALMQEHDAEVRANAGLAAELTSCREHLEKLKQRCEALGLENMDYQEALHRANTETAELGVHVCMLTADNQESSLRWEGLTTELQRLEEDALKADGLNQRMEELRQENRELQRQIQNRDELQQTERSEALQGAEAELKSEAETQKKHLQEVKLQLASQQEEVVLLQNKLQQLEAENQRCNQQMEQKDIQMAETANLLLRREDEILRLKEHLSRSEDSVAAAQQTCQEMAENLRMLMQDKQSLDLRTAAELDDLYRTKINLEERLVELIREKDVLWQKSDALEFEQKLRDEQTERDVNHCLGCHTQFSWWLRKYNCRLCGRPFCYYCCSNTVSTQQGGGREHCCMDCYNLHSAVVERHPQEEVVHGAPGTLSRLLQAGRAVTGIAGGGEEEKRQDDAVFDIITEEEVSGVYEGGSPSGCSPGCDQQGAAQLSSAASDGASDDVEDVGGAVQDAEICLLQSGELTLSAAFTVDDISAFGDGSRELFIKSSCYSVISVSTSAAGPTVCWTFTSEPKSISFSVVYRESAETPLGQAKVLIPLTRCNSHKETIQGELKVRNPGQYTLIFDNSFSRFISKRIRYRLSLDKPVVYDGTDLL